MAKKASDPTVAPETPEVEVKEVDEQGRPLKTPEGGDIIYL